MASIIHPGFPNQTPGRCLDQPKLDFPKRPHASPKTCLIFLHTLGTHTHACSPRSSLNPKKICRGHLVPRTPAWDQWFRDRQSLLLLPVKSTQATARQWLKKNSFSNRRSCCRSCCPPARGLDSSSWEVRGAGGGSGRRSCPASSTCCPYLQVNQPCSQ